MNSMMNFYLFKHMKYFTSLLALVIVAGCSGFGRSVPAPVEERHSSKSKASPSTAPVSANPQAVVTQPPQAKTTTPTEVNNRPGYYTVKQGDTLIRIGLDHGQNWRDIIRWNNIENPNVIEIGQVLRITPPAADTQTEVAVSKPVALGSVSNTVEDKKPLNSSEPVSVNSIRAEGSDDLFQLIWPAQGLLVQILMTLKIKV